MSLTPEELAALDLAVETLKRSGLSVKSEESFDLHLAQKMDNLVAPRDFHEPGVAHGNSPEKCLDGIERPRYANVGD